MEVTGTKEWHLLSFKNCTLPMGLLAHRSPTLQMTIGVTSIGIVSTCTQDFWDTLWPSGVECPLIPICMYPRNMMKKQ